MYEAETALLHQAGMGDTWAFGEFYDRTADQVFGVVAAILGSGEPAELVVRDVFIHTWRTARRFDASRECAVATILRTAYCLASRQLSALEAA